ncbi:MAG: phosphotransferase family protein [Rhizobiales bacterium 65-9]|nr:phosphotransferase family protein [Hyphomicrobiales bacterium]OJY35597.1 MAG: phosphotransferase family protein [Rhizobiales bacterium 65-9]
MNQREQQLVGARQVDALNRLDEVKLGLWLEANVDGYQGPATIAQFKGGQSNPSFRIDAGGKAYVLRRKPPGVLLPSAHAVDREFRVTAALHAAGFPVARPLALCVDDAVIGSMFYVMEMVEGRIFWSPALPDITPSQRRAIYEAEIDTLARLHAFDPAGLGLSDFGRPGNYFSRQTDRWTRQYRASETMTIEPMNRLMEWLPTSIPSQKRTSIVHGDFRLDNMIFDGRAPGVRAVLDWELSTLGDPLADLTYFLIIWAMPAGDLNGLAGLDLLSLGIPTLDEATQLYCARAGVESVQDLDWCFAYNLFRLAAIVQGIAGRVRDGTASNDKAAEAGKLTGAFAQLAWKHALKAGA